MTAMNALKLPSGLTYCTTISGRSVCTGSQMGRRNELPKDTNEPIELRMERLQFVDGDYDKWGAYWGANGCNHVYCAWGECEETQVRVFVRAQDRVMAKARVLEILPNATFAK